jgi:hypothetical protein
MRMMKRIRFNANPERHEAGKGQDDAPEASR